MLRLNRDLDRTSLAGSYAREGYVQIASLFPDDVAAAIEEALRHRTRWRLAVLGADGQVRTYREDALRGMSSADAAALQRDVLGRARDGFGFAYHFYPIVETYVAGEDKGHVLHDLLRWLNQDEWLDFGREIIGCSTVDHSDAQATLYAPGDFLTRHDDDYGNEHDRRAAFVIGFTRRWRTDWGGLLQLLDENDRVETAFAPQFNLVTFFKVPRWHSVSYVPPFAGEGRYSITGWLDHLS